VTGTASNQPYTLATYTSLVGTFTTTNLPPGYSINYGSTAITITTPVPEPAHLLLLCGGAAGAFGWWRRRPGRPATAGE
jgi:hypothetical protein